MPELLSRLLSDSEDGCKHLHAAAGHALAVLYRHTGTEADRLTAQQRLVQAVDGFDFAANARARALCAVRLAVLHLTAGELAEGADWGQRVLHDAGTVRSARIDRGIGSLRRLAASHPEESSASRLVADIDAAAGDGRSR